MKDASVDAHLAELYGSAPCGLLSVLPDGSIASVNRTFAGWVGLTVEDLAGRRFETLLATGSRIFHETHILPLLSMQGSVEEIAVDLVRSDGTVMPALLNASLVNDEQGAPELILLAMFGAAHRREYERELLMAKEEAEAAKSRAQTLARTLQDSLIPPAPPQIPGLEIGASYHPAGRGDEVGGDFYDVFQVGANDWIVTLGDVCGKGAGAATVTALARYTIRAAAITVHQPSGILSLLNNALMVQEIERFCTVACARIRLEGERVSVTISSGGHPLPIMVDSAGSTSPVGGAGDLLGVFEDPGLCDATSELAPGSSLVFYTDGVTEARVGAEFFGEKRLNEFLAAHASRGAAAMASLLTDEVIRFQDAMARDDIATVVVKVPAS